MISCVLGSWGRNPKKKEKSKEQRVKSKEKRNDQRVKSKGQGPGLQVTNPPNYEGGQVLQTTKDDKS
jgi:hypothetical protein